MNRQDRFDPVLWKRVVEEYERGRQVIAKFEVIPPVSPWIEGVDLDALYPRDCYFRALDYTIHESRLFEQHRLVHGETSLALGGHAWVELPNGLVFDGVHQRFYRRDDYYGEVAHATAWYLYDPFAAVRLNAYLKTPVGNWWCELDLPMIFNRPPIHVTEKYADELLDNYHISAGKSVLATLRKDTLNGIAERNGIKGGPKIHKADLVDMLVQIKRTPA